MRSSRAASCACVGAAGSACPAGCGGGCGATCGCAGGCGCGTAIGSKPGPASGASCRQRCRCRGHAHRCSTGSGPLSGWRDGAAHLTRWCSSAHAMACSRLLQALLSPRCHQHIRYPSPMHACRVCMHSVLGCMHPAVIRAHSIGWMQIHTLPPILPRLRTGWHHHHRHPPAPWPPARLARARRPVHRAGAAGGSTSISECACCAPSTGCSAGRSSATSQDAS